MSEEASRAAEAPLEMTELTFCTADWPFCRQGSLSRQRDRHLARRRRRVDGREDISGAPMPSEVPRVQLAPTEEASVGQIERQGGRPYPGLAGRMALAVTARRMSTRLAPRKADEDHVLGGSDSFPVPSSF